MSVRFDEVLMKIHKKRMALGIKNVYDRRNWSESEREFQKSRNGNVTRKEIGEPLLDEEHSQV